MSQLNKKPQVGKKVFIAPNATVVGDVILGEQSSVWYGAVLRGDSDTITVGNRTNIQDNAIIHADPGSPATLGHDVIVGHAAIVHGATIGDHTLVGMQAVILNDARIGSYCLIAAKTLILEGTEIPDNSVVMGSPGKVVKQLTPAQMDKILQNAETYVRLAEEHMKL